MSKNAFERIKAGLLDAMEYQETIKRQIAMRPLYKKLPIHVLVEDFLAPNYLDIKDVVRIAKVNPKRMQNLLHGEGKIDAALADKLGRMTGTGADYWLNLQAEFDAKGTLA